MLRRIDPRAALDEAKQLREAAEAQGDAVELARIDQLEGSCLWRLSDYTGALRALLSALERLPPDQIACRAAAQLDLAVVKQYFGLHDEAMDLGLSALSHYTQIGHDEGRADALNNLGIVFWKRGDFEESLRAYHESVELRRRLGDRDGEAGCRNNIAKTLTDQGSYELALRELAFARKTWSELENLRGLGVALNNIGIVYDRRGEPERASAFFHDSLALKERIGDRQGACETRTHIARLHLGQRRHREALSLLAKAVSDAEELGILAELAEAYAATSEVHEALGDHRAALDAYRRYHATERKLFNERSTERFHALQIAFQLERAEREGSTDGLTGLANRRCFDRQLRAGLQRMAADGEVLSVALLDLDGFKDINDRYGHAVGDDALRATASILRDQARSGDLPARYGGEEFALLFAGAGLAEAATLAEDLCARVRRYAWSSLHPELAVTISVGVATATGSTPDPEALLAAADENLYRAKHTGKDRVVA